VTSQVLDRGEHQPWATKWPVSSLGAMPIAAVVGIGIFTYCNIEMWTPLQQWYWVQYLNSKTFPDGARRLQAADEGGCARQAAHGCRC
jgi:hypothetical protein